MTAKAGGMFDAAVRGILALKDYPSGAYGIALMSAGCGEVFGAGVGLIVLGALLTADHYVSVFFECEPAKQDGTDGDAA